MTAVPASLDSRFADAMGALIGPGFPADLGLAVSGGGDSMAMLTLAHNWTRVWGVRLWVVTVDHGLRPEAAAEARLVSETCAELGWPHAVLRWRWDGQGNVMDAARRARLGLIGRWRGGLRHVAFAHTEDDLAEGFVMRLVRGAGADGLAAMAAARAVAPGFVPGDIDGPCPPGTASGDLTVIRPCLGMQRAELRHYLRVLKGRWVEDPTNADPRYDRARVRGLLDTLAQAGADKAALAGAARRLGRARDALAARAVSVWESVGTEDTAHGVPTGDLLIDRDRFAGVERDTQARVFAAALRWVSSSDYPPRAEALETALDRALGGGDGTLHGCVLRIEGARLRIGRERAALPEGVPADGGLWDGRWRAVSSGATLAALGDAGWRQLPVRPSIPRAAALALPALWRGATLLSCPAAGLGDRGVTLCPMGRDAFPLPALLKSH